MIVPDRFRLGTLCSAKFSVVVFPWVTATPGLLTELNPNACAVTV